MLERRWLRLRYCLRELAGCAPQRVAFLHIPKCGGTTIFRHFKTNLGSGRSAKIVHLNSMELATLEDGEVRRAQRAPFVFGHIGWNTLSTIGDGAFRFTVLREPLERLTSLYRYARTKAKPDRPVFAGLLELAKQRSFGDFCLSQEPEVKALIDNAMTRTIADDYYPLRPWNRRDAVATATEHLAALDLVLDLNDLDTSLPRLAALTGTRMARKQTRSNQTPPAAVELMSRAEFESDAALRSLIACDSVLYRRALGIDRREPLGASATASPE